MNNCGEISLSGSKFCSLGDNHYENPNLTYPTVTKMGIREMTRQQQQNYYQRYLETPQEREIRMNERILQLEETVKSLSDQVIQLKIVVSSMENVL